MKWLGSQKSQLRWLLAGVFLALAAPSVVLTVQAYQQLRWEAFHQQRLLAEELVARIDSDTNALIAAEEARAFTDYGFLVVTGERYIQRSPLSNLPPASDLPGLVGYFQVDADGAFSTPLLPATPAALDALALTAEEYEQRLNRQSVLRRLLAQASTAVSKRAVGSADTDAAVSYDATDSYDATGVDAQKTAAPASAPARIAAKAESGALENAQEQIQEESELDAAVTSASKDIFRQFDLPENQVAEEGSLSNRYGRVDQLKLDDAYETRGRRKTTSAPTLAETPTIAQQSGKRLERNRAVDGEAFTGIQTPAELPVDVFESEVDPLIFNRLDAEHFVLYRKVWRDGQRFVQGAVVQQQAFLEALIEKAFRDAAISQNAHLVIAYAGDVLRVLRPGLQKDYLSRSSDLAGNLLLRANLSAPAADLGLIFSAAQLPVPPGSTTITWAAAIIALVLCAGFIVIYQTGMRQIRLAEQQQDFVSAVSHELKTPLTSIRMYGEILKAGWADEAKKRTYYDFIFSESERLTRLINNVLQLARLTRNEHPHKLADIQVQELLEQVTSKVSSAVESAGFVLEARVEPPALNASVRVDTDAFAQIMINLVDNALKFSANASRKTIELGCRLKDGGVEFSVRDFGPGVAKDQMKMIFKLFYRSENELTRVTVGTGIGLALVSQLVDAMHGEIDLVNREPGAEFRVVVPLP